MVDTIVSRIINSTFCYVNIIWMQTGSAYYKTVCFHSLRLSLFIYKEYYLIYLYRVISFVYRFLIKMGMLDLYIGSVV